MNVWNRLFGSTPKPELANLDGCFYLCRPSITVKGSKECLYQTAVASIRRTEQPFNYQLVVNRSVTEEEAQLLDDEADLIDDEQVYLISHEIAFRATPVPPSEADKPGQTAFTWTLGPDEEETYMFVIDGATKAEIAEFEDTIYRCMWERDNSRPGKDATKADLLDYHYTEPAPPAKASPARKNPLFRAPSPEEEDDVDDVADDLVNQIAGISLRKDSPSPTPEPEQRQVKEESPAPTIVQPQLPSRDEISASTRDPPSRRQIFHTQVIDLYLYDIATGNFMCQEQNVEAVIWHVEGSDDYTCWMTVVGDGGYTWISCSVDASLDLSFQQSHQCLMISLRHTQTSAIYTWSFRFPDLPAFNRFNTATTQALFDANLGKGSFKKLKPEEQKFAEEMYTDDVDMVDQEYYDEEAEEQELAKQEEEYRRESSTEPEDESEEESESEPDEEEQQHSKGKGKNSALAVGYKGLTFVVRNDMIGVFENQKGASKKLKFKTTINGLSKPGSKNTFQPGKLMLHNQDTSIVLSDPMNPQVLYRLDLGTGKVVDEWKVSDNLDVTNFLPSEKLAQTTGKQDFIGTSQNAIFRIDPRLSGTKLVDAQYKQYAGSANKYDFSAAATTESGKLVVASRNGEIRLFDSIGKNAKTSLASLGHAIKAIDVTADGRYVVATTKTYLLFIDTKITEGKYQGELGFDRAIPVGARNCVRRLQLTPYDVSMLEEMGEVNFTPAKFNMGEGAMEKSIVTSTGPWVVSWNFRSVKAGKYDTYRLRRYDETIVADEFSWGNDREIIVTMPSDVVMERTADMQKSNKRPSATFGPRSSIRTGNIVQEYQ